MIIVNPSTRQFNIPGADLVFGVTADSGSEVKHFQCPRYVGNNVDIASSFVRINYQNANGQMDSHLVEDLAVIGDNVTFSWELAPLVTAYRGQVKFVMCVVGPDLKVKWHTTQGYGQVLEGLEPDFSHVEDETSDVVAQLIDMVEAQTTAVEAEGAKQINAVRAAAKTAETASVAEIQAKGVNTLNNIPADYTALSGVVDGLVRGRAGAIVCEATGSAVAVNDASDMAFQGMRIFGRSTQNGVPSPEAPVEIKSVEKPVVTMCGKNLIAPETNDEVRNGFTRRYNPEDGSITISGTATAAVDTVVQLKDMNANPFLKGGLTYTLKVCKDGTPVPFGIKQVFTDGDVTWGWKQVEIRDRRITQIYLQKTPAVGDTSFCGTYRIQLEVGSEATEYEPYKTLQTLATTHTLPGIPVTSGGNYTDSDGQQWICDEVDLERGVYVQRVRTEVFDGSDDEGWRRDYTSDETKKRMTTSLLAEIVKRVANNQVANILCSRFVKARADDTYSLLERVSIDDLGRLHIYSNDYNDLVEDWTSFLVSNPMTVVCELTTPIETPLSETEIAAYRALHSNYPNTTVLNDSGAHMVVKYAADTKLYIDNKIKEALQ